MSARRPIATGPLPLAQHADHAGAADAAVHLDAERLELARHESEVRCSSKPSSGLAWKSWRVAVRSAWNVLMRSKGFMAFPAAFG